MAEERTNDNVSRSTVNGLEDKRMAKVAAAPKVTEGLETVGKNYLIYLNTGSADVPEWTKLGGQRGGGITRKADTIDASHKDSGGWKTTLQGLKEWSMDVDTVIMTNDEGFEALNKAFLAGQNVQLKFEYPNKKYVTGWASITELSISAPHDDVATHKGTLSGIGPLSELQG